MKDHPSSKTTICVNHRVVSQEGDYCSTKSKYSILKYICSLSFGYLKQHCCMGITLLTKEITPRNIFYRNEIQYRDDVPTKRKVGM